MGIYITFTPPPEAAATTPEAEPEAVLWLVTSRTPSTQTVAEPQLESSPMMAAAAAESVASAPEVALPTKPNRVPNVDVSNAPLAGGSAERRLSPLLAGDTAGFSTARSSTSSLGSSGGSGKFFGHTTEDVL